MGIRNHIKQLLFSSEVSVIKTGPSKGMKTLYDVKDRFQHLMGLYEREVYKYLRRGIAKSKRLVDVGANDGYYVLAFLKTGKRTIACEPSAAYADLVRNAELNGFVEGQHYQLERRMVGDPGKGNYVSIKEVLEGSNDAVFFLVDIDGGEMDLLESCGNDFPFEDACWLIETHSKQLEDDCVAFLQSVGYRVTIIDRKWWRLFLPEQRTLEHNRWLYAEWVVE